MSDTGLALVGFLILGTSTSHRWIDRLPITGPVLALVLGVLAGPAAAGLIEIPRADQLSLLREVSRLTLAVSLMAVALRYPASELRARVREVAVLLVVVMPAMALVTTGLGVALLGLGGGLALALGTALAPTDPVLASSVVSGAPAEQTIPDRLRQVLSIESGANDGLALPMVTLAAAVVTTASLGGAIVASIWDVAGAVVLGAALGWLAAALLRGAERHGAVDRAHAATYSLVLSLTALGLGGLLRTDGLLMVFATGLAFNARLDRSERDAEESIDDSVHLLLVLPLFVILGVVLPWERWGELGWPALLFAVAVLVLRRLPTVLLLRRPLGLQRPAALWLGWFGPVGVAAVYYLTHLEHVGVADPVVWSAGSLVVTVSTLVHGATATAGVRAYGRWGRSDGAG